MQKVSTGQKGFTIIEVLIVMAIAGLILSVVFLAVPALNRNAHNTQRKQDGAIILAYVRETITHNMGQLPATCNNTQSSCFVRDSKLSVFDNQSSTTNFVSFTNLSAAFSGSQLNPSNSADHQKLVITSYAKCNGTNLSGTGAQRKNIAAQFVLEAFGGGTLYCLTL